MNWKLPAFTPLRWVAVTVITALLLGVSLTWTHYRQAAAQDRISAALDRFRDSRTETARGFLAVNLSGLPGAPYDRTQGLALLAQADQSLDAFLELWSGDELAMAPDVGLLVSEFHRQNQLLQKLTAGTDELGLRVAYFQLDRLADRLEDLTRAEVADRSQRFGREFAVVMAGALLALLALGGVLFTLARDKDRAESRLAQAAKDLGIGFWHRDATTGKTEVTEAWWTLLGRTPESTVPSMAEWSTRLHPDDRGPFLAKVAAFMNSADTSMRTEYRVQQPDGSYRWIQVMATVTRDAKGSPLAQFGCNLDITEAKHLEADRQSLQAQVVQSQKAEAIGQLAGGIAHDLNNLLVPLLTYSDLGLRGTGSKPPEHYFRRIKEVADRAQALTRQILAFSRQQVLEKRPVDLSALVAGFEPMLRRLLPEILQFEVHQEPGLPPMLADPGQVEQVLLNLVVNARDAMPDGGVLGVSTAVLDLDESFAATHYGTEPGRYVVLTVSDTGVGMSPETQARIFEPFFTTKPRGEGTGLGLATVQGIVRQHGGQIGVYSEEGKGAVFRIYWPVWTEGEAVPEPPTPTPSAGGTETLLVVEDEPIVREVVSESLESQGYRVLAFGDPRRALEVTEDYALLVTDVVMPGLTGRELRDQLVARRPGLKVLYISGYTDRILSGADREGPGQGFLQKPFAVDVLCQKVRDLLDGRI